MLPGGESGQVRRIFFLSSLYFIDLSRMVNHEAKPGHVFIQLPAPPHLLIHVRETRRPWGSKLWGSPGRPGEGKAPACPGFSAGLGAEEGLLYLGWGGYSPGDLLQLVLFVLMLGLVTWLHRGACCWHRPSWPSAWTSFLAAPSLALLGMLQMLPHRQTALSVSPSLPHRPFPFPLSPSLSHHLTSLWFQSLELAFAKSLHHTLIWWQFPTCFEICHFHPK